MRVVQTIKRILLSYIFVVVAAAVVGTVEVTPEVIDAGTVVIGVNAGVC